MSNVKRRLSKKVASLTNTAQNINRKMHLDTSSLVLWRNPPKTVYFFIKELFFILVTNIKSCLNYRKTVFSAICMSILIGISYQIEGAHLPIILFIRKKLLWYSYWIGLGVASSIGLGSGLHTFLLYLGPFIAKVTMAAYECGSLNFVEPPYPDDIVCPSDEIKKNISFLGIMSKVRWESFMWGLGTAIGELPPYYMARAAALGNRQVSSGDSENEDLAQFEELLAQDPSRMGFFDRCKFNVFRVIKKVGFFGILLCASIPNPLFDLAGITCGHFLVPFWTFFGATMIGKAVIKMHIQKLFVIALFSEGHVEKFVDLMMYIPMIGTHLAPLFQQFLLKEKLKFKQSTNSTQQIDQSESLLSWLMGKFVLCMILFFIVSIINSLAQKHAKRTHQEKAQKD